MLSPPNFINEAASSDTIPSRTGAEIGQVLKKEDKSIVQDGSSVAVLPLCTNHANTQDSKPFEIGNQTSEIPLKPELSLELELSNIKVEVSNDMESNNSLEISGNDTNLSKIQRKKYHKQRGHDKILSRSETRKYHLKHSVLQNEIKTEQQESPPPPTKKFSNSKKPWECKICDALFSDGKKMLVSHIVSEHVKIAHPKCNICDTSLISKEMAIEHIAQHAPMRCALCKQENIETFDAFEEHLHDKHSSDIMCTICELKVESSNDMMISKDIVSHMLEHQIKKDLRKCPGCQHYHTLPKAPACKGSIHGRFSNQPLLNHNIKSGSMECCFCSYRCEVDKYSMKVHIIHYHDKEVGYSSTEMKSKPKLSTWGSKKRALHSRLAEAARVWKCKLCEIRMDSQYQLLAHFFGEHVKRIGPTCLVCGAPITMDQIGVDHILLHSSMHSNDTFCTICDKEMIHSEDIVHIKEHQKHIKHKCPMCLQYHFASSSKSSLFMMHNTQPGKMQCPLCGFSCAIQGASDNMKIHLRTVHRKYFQGILRHKDKEDPAYKHE